MFVRILRFLRPMSSFNKIKTMAIHSVFQKGGGNPNFENFKKEGQRKKIGGGTKRGKDFQKERGTQLFKSKSGVEKDKDEDL